VKRILYVVNVDWFFVSHRLPLAIEAVKRGYEVFVITKNTGFKSEIEKTGAKFIHLEFDRSGKNPLQELTVIFKLYFIYRKLSPDLVHHVTLKPALYGTMALKMLNSVKPEIVNAVTGLGYNFTDERKSGFQKVLLRLMQFAFKYSSTHFIFQNPDDLNFYIEQGLIKEGNSIIIKGSGVDTNTFQYSPPFKNSQLKVILNARMLFDKGIIEFCKAAHVLKSKWQHKAIFQLVGDLDPQNLAGATKSDIEKFLIPGYIEWIGHRKDVAQVLKSADIVCLPSYREGLPKSLLEAMAIGRPIVTTDSPGCRECVEEGVNGFLVPVRDVELLSKRLNELLSSESLRLKMGERSRIKMEQAQMSLDKVIERTFKFYDKMLDGI
jgi:glycosyltransferase involved in cell wall biosynthesis